MSDRAGGSARVLFVAGDRSVLSSVARRLDRCRDGFDVVTEADPSGARERLSDGVDCVVSGYRLPETDGVEFLEAVRENRPDLPFVLVVDGGSEAIAAAAVSADVTEYLPRAADADPDELAERVADAVSRTDSAPPDDRSRWRRFGALVEHATDVISVLGTDGTFRYVTPSSERVLGYDPDDLIGEQWFEYVHPDDRASVMEVFYEGIDYPDRSPTVTFRFEHRTGDWRVLEARCRNLFDDPLIEGTVVYTRDVTEREVREDQLRRQNERLEAFASVVSHDLRNPLTAADGWLDVARTRHGLEDSDPLDAVERALDRMDDLIDDLLTLARQGRAIDETGPVSLADAVEEAWRTTGTESSTLEVDPALGAVEADRARLVRLFENLFRNAVEHGAAGGSSAIDGAGRPERSASGVNASPPDPAESAQSSAPDADEGALANGGGVTVRVGALSDGFYVADDGPGIDHDDLDRVFESGFTTASEGTGFGLAIVREIAEAHGWTVAAVDSESSGARFEVTGVDSVPAESTAA